jgi:RimJ/RimL family protein N-acetyltransferase
MSIEMLGGSIMTVDANDLGQRPDSRPAMRTKLVRYETVDGVPTLKDSQLTHLFEKAKEERLLPLVMYNVNPDTPTAAFLRMYKNNAGRILWLVFYDDELAGWVWLDDIANRTARSHFCFFRWLSRAKISEEAGREMFWQLFQLKSRNGVMLQVIRAEMPAFNKPALWFLEKVGFSIVGEIPNAAYRFSTGKFYPMIYLYMTKDMLKMGRVSSVSPDTPAIVPVSRSRLGGA